MPPTPATRTPPGPIVYPESDGKPLAENTLQLQWIMVFVGNLMALFQDAADVFVGGDQLWYPVEGHPEITTAPDAYVVFGRPKGHRDSYKQWEEGDVPMTVVFEVLSPGNTPAEMKDKHQFYEEYGVEEYYIFDPGKNKLEVWVRRRTVLVRHRKVNGFASPRLGIRFDLSGEELVVYGPNGKRFLTFVEIDQVAVREALRADRAEQRAGSEAQRAEKAERRAEKAEQRAARMAELTIKVLRQQASAVEVQELERLLASPTH